MPSSRPVAVWVRPGLAIALALATSAAAAASHYTSRVVQQPHDLFQFETLSHDGIGIGEIQVVNGSVTSLASYLQGPHRSAQFRPFGARASRATAMSSAGDIVGVIEDRYGQPSQGYVRRRAGVPVACSRSLSTAPA